MQGKGERGALRKSAGVDVRTGGKGCIKWAVGDAEHESRWHVARVVRSQIQQAEGER
jgi:hypothetical protein